MIKEGLVIADSSNATTNMFITVLSALAQMEAELISERTKEALAELKRKGVRLGRRPGCTSKKILDDHRDELEGYLATRKSKTWIAGKLGVSRQTLYNYLELMGR